jgi:hypothetical protein
MRTTGAIVVAALAHFIFGAVWFTVLKQPWLDSVGKSEQQLAAAGNAGLAYTVAFVCNLLMAGVLVFVLRTRTSSVISGIQAGAVLGFGIAAAALVTELIFEARSGTGMIIASLFPAIGCVIMGAIIGALLPRV